MTGMAVGAAAAGYRVVCHMMFANFLYTGFDAIANQAAKLRYMTAGQIRLPIVYMAVMGAGRSAGAQHSDVPYPMLMNLGGIKVAVPSTPADAKGLLKAAIRDDNPVLMFEHKLLYGSKGARAETGSVDGSSEIPSEDYTVPIGKGIVRREGSDVTIVGTLLMAHYALAAAEFLAREGVSAEVIDPRSLIPFDWELVTKSVKKTSRLVVVTEGPKTGGVGAEIAATASELLSDYLTAPVKRVASPDIPTPFAPPMENYYRPDPKRIVAAIME